jgi:hypothetical protein
VAGNEESYVIEDLKICGHLPPNIASVIESRKEKFAGHISFSNGGGGGNN